MEKIYHSYHIVSVSPWPLFVGISVLSVVVGLIKLFIYKSFNLLMFSFFMLVLVCMMWFRDIVRESTFQGAHSSDVLKGLMLGMVMFIISEIFFFLSFFWTFFHFSLNPSVELGVMWPPWGIKSFNPFQIPLLNTVILLSSGVSITVVHQLILNENWKMASNMLLMTWILGLYFLLLQLFEYYMSEFGISDSVFGSVFFMATGFHGLHVMIGTLFLMVMWLRMIKFHFSSCHHFGFESGAWYWHFVDVVWLFLFFVVYWWGG